MLEEGRDEEAYNYMMGTSTRRREAIISGTGSIMST